MTYCDSCGAPVSAVVMVDGEWQCGNCVRLVIDDLRKQINELAAANRRLYNQLPVYLPVEVEA